MTDHQEASNEIRALRDIQKELIIAREYHTQQVAYLHRQIHEVDRKIEAIARDAR